jgi:hypothetical protein
MLLKASRSKKMGKPPLFKKTEDADLSQYADWSRAFLGYLIVEGMSHDVLEDNWWEANSPEDRKDEERVFIQLRAATVDGNTSQYTLANSKIDSVTRMALLLSIHRRWCYLLPACAGSRALRP